MHRILLIFCALCSISVLGIAEDFGYADKVYKENIKSVQLYNTREEQSSPIISLKSGETLLLQFDELSRVSKQYYYTIEHCDEYWKPSPLSPLDYLETFTEDRILQYTVSFNTFVKYIHYEVEFPNGNIIPKLSGNYLLKVFEEGNRKMPVITRRFYIVEKITLPEIQVVGSNLVENHRTHQKVSLEVDIQNLEVQNAYTDVHLLLTQNGRPDCSLFISTPTYINGSKLIFSDMTSVDMPGGNEFRRFDIRQTRFITQAYRDSVIKYRQPTDIMRSQKSYETYNDLDGKFFIRCLNQQLNPKSDADYVLVNCTLVAPELKDKQGIYLIGKFNDWTIHESYRMNYIPEKEIYNGYIFIKMGVHDYHYVVANTDTKEILSDSFIDGNYFETQNFYEVLVYAKKAQQKWTSLVGTKYINTGGSIRYLKD